jgi:hypothetical protein
VAAVVDDAYLGTLRAIAELRKCAPCGEEHADLVTRWRSAGIVADKPPQAGDKMYGEAIDPAKLPALLSDGGRSQLAADLAALDPAAVARSFPRDRNGFVLGQTVLLAAYEPAQPIARKKAPWLVARGPLRRSHPQVIALLFDVIDATNFPAQWPRHLWDRRAVYAGERERWGVERLPLPLLDAEERSARVESLTGASGEAEKAALSLLLLDEGRFADAFALYGVRIRAALAEAIEGHPALAFRELIVEGHGDMGDTYLTHAANRDAEGIGARWAQHLHTRLHRAAPWLLPHALPAPKRRPVRERLFTLPYSAAARRPAVFLVADAGGVALEVDFSGTNAYLPHPRWERPIELDLLRFGLA